MEVKTEDEDLEVENAFRIISKQRVMDFTAPNAEARETFVNKLQETVDELASKRESYRRARNIEVLKEGDLGKKAPTWVRDEAVSMCMLCDVMFTRFRRRHHCRACGRVVCGNCSGYKAALEFKNGKLEKVCEVCHRILVKGSTEEKAKEAVVKGKSILKIDSDKRIWHSGYLSFKMKGDKTWQKRWFVLSSDFVLFRYKAKKVKKITLVTALSLRIESVSQSDCLVHQQRIFSLVSDPPVTQCKRLIWTATLTIIFLFLACRATSFSARHATLSQAPFVWLVTHHSFPFLRLSPTAFLPWKICIFLMVSRPCFSNFHPLFSYFPRRTFVCYTYYGHGWCKIRYSRQVSLFQATSFTVHLENSHFLCIFMNFLISPYSAYTLPSLKRALKNKTGKG